MEQDIKILEKFTKIVKGKDYNAKNGWHGYYDEELMDLGTAIEHLIKAYKELEEKNKKKSIEIICYQEELENSIPVSLVEEKLKKEKLPNIIVGGRRNAKTLEYDKKLGRIEMCEELLEKRK